MPAFSGLAIDHCQRHFPTRVFTAPARLVNICTKQAALVSPMKNRPVCRHLALNTGGQTG
jgi:hypothetical protein